MARHFLVGVFRFWVMGRLLWMKMRACLDALAVLVVGVLVGELVVPVMELGVMVCLVDGVVSGEELVVHV